MRISVATVTSPGSASDSDAPRRAQRPPRRDQPTAPKTTTTTMVDTLTWTIRLRGVSIVSPTAAACGDEELVDVAWLFVWSQAALRGQSGAWPHV
jgi:hypothetical protein